MKKKCPCCDGTGEVIVQELEVRSNDGKINRGLLTVVNVRIDGIIKVDAFPPGAIAGDRICVPSFPMLYWFVERIYYESREFSVAPIALSFGVVR